GGVFDLERSVGRALEPCDDFEAMHRAPAQCAQYEQIQRSLENRQLGRRHTLSPSDAQYRVCMEWCRHGRQVSRGDPATKAPAGPVSGHAPLPLAFPAWLTHLELPFSSPLRAHRSVASWVASPR